MEQQNIRPLTTMRIFAAFWVVLYDYWAFLIPGPLPAFIAKGYLGVELFFVLSGFIICHVYLQKFGEGRFSYRSFLWARLARIYPLHIAILAGLIVLVLGAAAEGLTLSGGMAQWGSIPGQVLMLQAWGFTPEGGWNHPAWSISAEWFAYLTFPAFAWAALKLKARPLVAVALAILFMTGLYAAFQALAGFSLTHATIRWGALRIVPCFAYGCALHALWRARPADSRSQALLGAAFSGAGVLMAAAAGAPDTLIVVGLGAIIFFLARLAETGSELLSAAPLVYLGEISYSVYMICIPWRIVFPNLVTRVVELNNDQLPLGLWLVFVASVVPLAALSYHLVEKPARNRMKLMAEAWATRRPSAATA